jgi:hypothetical protein
MKIRTITICMLLLASALSKGGSGTVADLSPELREALVRDGACARDSGPVGAGPADLLQSPIITQDIHSAGRGDAGVIAAFTGGCHCHGVNCSTFVYLKAAGFYKLAVTGYFVSLHPMKVYRNGLPSLTAKSQVSETRAETTVYDWNGATYKPSLCATVTQSENQKRPSIARHACSSEPRPE